MRYRLMASYQGASFQAGIGPSDEAVTLFAACPPPEELGFRSSSGHWRKRVRVEEIDALWESRPIGRYRGQRCMVLDDLGDRLHIAYLGRDLYLARRLGFWEVDRGVFEVVVPRPEVNDLHEERGEYELAVLDDAGPAGSWEAGPRELWASNPRDYDAAPDTGPLRAVGAPRELIDTGPPWAVSRPGPAGPAGPGGWDARDVQAQDPRDTGTWAAVRDLDPRDAPEPDGPFPRGRGGWRATDTGSWQAPDTGAWDAREVAGRAAREANRAPGARAALPGRSTGSWSAREVADAAARDARDMRDAPDPREIRDARNPRDARNTGGWSPAQIAEAAALDARDMRASRDLRDLGDTDGGWDMREMTPGGRRDMDRRDPQETAVWNPASAGAWDAPDPRWARRAAGPAHARPDGAGMGGWAPNEAVRPASQQRTPDAAAAWHGSQAPPDRGRWAAPVPADVRSTPPRLAIGSGMAPGAPGTGPQPTAAYGYTSFDEPPLARQAAAATGTYSTPAAPVGSDGAPGTAGRHGGRRSAGKTRVTAQAVFSQLLDQASIPRSSYAVDAEVDGAMCLVHTRGGCEVFSSADRTRHEVRYFEDEEAAYFYLFGILAAEAIRSGHLGPQTAPPGHHSRPAHPGYPPAR